MLIHFSVTKLSLFVSLAISRRWRWFCKKSGNYSNNCQENEHYECSPVAPGDVVGPAGEDGVGDVRHGGEEGVVPRDRGVCLPPEVARSEGAGDGDGAAVADAVEEQRARDTL